MLILPGLIDRAGSDAWGVFSVKFTDQTFLTHVRIIVLCEEFLYLNYSQLVDFWHFRRHSRTYVLYIKILLPGLCPQKFSILSALSLNWP